jgi:2-polyprenyl-3-methyl-5-hydroxy-6-metoxy-1,4-benzoquinol methylase
MTVDARAAADTFREATCTAPVARTQRMRDLVVRHVPGASAALRVLDLGCGTGSLVFELAGVLTGASIIGIDISAANIRAARAQQAARKSAKRIAFEHVDYLAYEAPPFDVVVSDGVLHLMQGKTETIVAKLGRDLRSGGVLVCAMPYDCAYNRVFALVRRGLRLVRSRATDALILAAGRALHGRDMDEAGLRERIQYMYMPPTRLETRALTAEIAPSAGLRAIAHYPMPSASLSQLRHRVTIYEKREG